MQRVGWGSGGDLQTICWGGLIWIHRSLCFLLCPTSSHKLKIPSEIEYCSVLTSSNFYSSFIRNIFTRCLLYARYSSGYWYYNWEQQWRCNIIRGNIKFVKTFKKLKNQSIFQIELFLSYCRLFILASVARLICCWVSWYLWSQIKMEKPKGVVCDLVFKAKKKKKKSKGFVRFF